MRSCDKNEPRYLPEQDYSTSEKIDILKITGELKPKINEPRKNILKIF